MNNISRNITISEAIKSKTAIKHGINNIPDKESLANMELVANRVFQPVRDYYDTPIAVTSFFRSKELNSKLGGSSTSQHCTGEAIDIDADVFGNVTNSDVFNYIKDNLMFDQLIWEFGDDDNPAWVHVSYSQFLNRGVVLQAYKERTVLGRMKTKYKYYDK